MFLFDIYLPPPYPNSPPEVYFHSWTEGMGRVNPNLYEEGKVCLSLLGTWFGKGSENWNPAASNILQVLVSIQGLVLVQEPYYNEAGFEKQVGFLEGEVNSKLYNERAFLLSTKFILRLLTQPAAPFVREIYDYYIRRRTLPAVISRLAALVSPPGEAENRDPLFTSGVSKGCVISLRRPLGQLQALLDQASQ